MYVGKLAQRQNSFKHVQGTYWLFHSHVCKIVSAFVQSNNMEDNYSGALKATASLLSNAFLCKPLWAERILINQRAPVLVGGHSLCCAALVCPIVGFRFEYCPPAYLSGFIDFQVPLKRYLDDIGTERMELPGDCLFIRGALSVLWRSDHTPHFTRTKEPMYDTESVTEDM